MIEITCSGCKELLLIDQAQYKHKKSLGRQNFYHKNCFKPKQAWIKKYV